MSQHLFRIDDEAANAEGNFTIPAGERLVKEWQPKYPLAELLDDFLYACWLPGRWVQRVWVLADLPPRLERRARSLSRDSIWRAYTDGARLWFAIAAAADISYRAGVVAMKVLFFENDGALCSGGIWMRDPIGDWRLERLVDMAGKARGAWDVPG
jgi:hypothetical protein